MIQLTFDGKTDSLAQEIGAQTAQDISKKKQLGEWQKVTPEGFGKVDNLNLDRTTFSKGIICLYSIL